MPASSPSLQDLCELGSEQLIQTKYLDAEATLAGAEAEAWNNRDWDTLARLYMPLQEARRQRRQRCGEGVVALDLMAQGPSDRVNARHVLENFPHGQLLVAGWHSAEPAIELRRLAAELGLYVETFLGAVYQVGGRKQIVIAPHEDAALPARDFENVDDLKAHLPANCLFADEGDISRGHRKGTPETFGEVMALWERLHAPFLAAADGESDPVRQIEGYRMTTRVDYASELAHQKLSDVAHRMSREARQRARGG
jgi:hypothetical protein